MLSSSCWVLSPRPFTSDILSPNKTARKHDGTNLTLYTEKLMLIREVIFLVTNSAFIQEVALSNLDSEAVYLAEIYHGFTIVSPDKCRNRILN